MDTRQAVLVDACATDVTGGTPVGYLPDGDDLTDDQLQAVADELAAPVAVPDGDGLRVLTRSGSIAHQPAATIGAVQCQYDRGEREAGEQTLEASGNAVAVEITSDGGVWLDRPTPRVRETSVDESAVGAALEIDAAALRDVGADLPPLSLSVGQAALAVPVNFLEHVGNAQPNPTALGEIVARAEVDVLCVFTFDTLGPDAAVHARTFAPPETAVGCRTVGLELPATPAVAGGLVWELSKRNVIEAATTSVEQGHFLDRPGHVHVEVGERLRVGGHAVTALDGTVTVPEAAEDDIIEP
jgi:PhzF family phenazine biosynthesis protein